MGKYRSNVALLLVDAGGALLVCERAKMPDSWQFPQGGVDRGETLEEALFREVEEEIGLPRGSYELVESRDGYRYDYPPKVGSRKRHVGQKQTYFLCRLKDDAPPVNVHQRPREFQSHRWIDPAEFSLKWLPAFKRDVYRKVLRDFFGVDL